MVKNDEIELLKESLSGGGGVVARKTVGESLGGDVFFFSPPVTHTTLPMKHSARTFGTVSAPFHKVSEGLSHCGPELGIAVNIVSQFQLFF